MSRVGEVDSAEGFFDWCSGVLLAREHLVRADVAPHARYTVDGGEADVEWPTFQLDGLGLWIWAAREHAARQGIDPDRWRAAAELPPTTSPATGVGPAPTGGRNARASTWPRSRACGRDWSPGAGPRQTTSSPSSPRTDDARLDASLLVLDAPLGVRHVDVSCFDPLLSPGGGVHRHLEDTYYGGGEWLF